MALKLYPYQQIAYNNVKENLERDRLAAVVFPTGCGKSFVALQLLLDNAEKRAIFISPLHEINRQLREYIEKYIGKPWKEVFPNLQMYLYQGIFKMKDDVMQALKPDIIILDEIHRTGAEKWEEQVRKLLDMYPDAKVLGLTATPDRMDSRNMVEEMFEGNIAAEITMPAAIARGIIKPPKYVTAIYSFKEEIEDLKKAIDECEDESKKRELKEKYETVKRALDKAEGLSEVFSQNMPKKDGKYIVFCKDEEHMKIMMEEAKKWVKDVDETPEIYSVYSDYGTESNRRQIKRFQTSKTDHLKLLFSIEMLNEGVHLEDISGVIMLRPTESKIVYLQQLGRALSSDENREQPIVFDLVNNWRGYDLNKEIKRIRRMEEAEKGGKNGTGKLPSKDINNFIISADIRELAKLIGEMEEILEISSLQNAKAIQEWSEEQGRLPRFLSKVETEEAMRERKLSKKLSAIRQRIMKQYADLEPEKIEDASHRQIVKIIRELDEKYKESIFLQNTKKIQAWSEEHGRLPSELSRPKTKEEILEKSLAIKLSTIRQNIIRKYMHIKPEEIEDEEHRQIVEIIRELDEKYYVEKSILKNAKELEVWCEEHSKLPRSLAKAQTKEETIEKSLAIKLTTIRTSIMRQYADLPLEEIENEVHRQIVEMIRGLDEKYYIEKSALQNAREIKAWCEAYCRLPKSLSKTETEEQMREKLLAQKLSKIKQYIMKQYAGLSPVEIEDEEHRQIVEMIREVEEAYKGDTVFLQNAKAIQAWCEAYGRLPKGLTKTKNQEEKTELEFSKKLTTIKSCLMNKYEDLPLEEIEDEEHRQIIAIIRELDEKYYVERPSLLKNAKEVEEWCKRNRRLPRSLRKPKNETETEEQRLAKRFNTIKQTILKKYNDINIFKRVALDVDPYKCKN